MRSPEVSIHFALCSFVRHKSGADLPLTQFVAVEGARLVFANAQFFLNLSVSRRSCASICRTFFIISGVLLVDGRPERASVVSFSSRKRLNHSILFRSRLPSRTPAPTFHASPLQSFPQFVAELDVCTLLHCAVTLPLILSTFNWQQLLNCRSHAVYSASWILPMSLKNHAHARTHMRQAAIQIWHHSPNFLDTSYIGLLFTYKETTYFLSL